MLKVCVFCGSSMGYGEKYRQAAKALADYFVENNISLVYGGASVGLMNILAETLLENQKEVIGVMPQLLIDKEVAHHQITQMIVVESMSERKQKMEELSDGFIALPGGFGTLDELTEIMTLNQLRVLDKPIGILNVDGYFDKLFEFFDHSVESGFVRTEYRNNLIVSDNIEALIAEMKKYQPLSMGKWVEDIKIESGH